MAGEPGKCGELSCILHVGLEMPVRQARGDAERASNLHDSGALGRGQGWNMKLRASQVIPFMEDCSKNKQKICKSIC